MAIPNFKNQQNPNKPPTTQKSDGLRVCIALKDNASFFLLSEVGVAAQAVWYQAAQKVGLSLWESCHTGCAELGKDQTSISEWNAIKGTL